MTLKLTRAEADQLLAYAAHRDRDGWYYGNKAQFERRHEALKRKLEEVLTQEEGR